MKNANKSQKQGSILFRTALLSLAVTILTLSLFIVFIVPYQKSILIERLHSTAQIVATSLRQVTITSIVVEDYSTIIEHCQKVVSEQTDVRYLVITRKDGFSLVTQESGWTRTNLEGIWLPVDVETSRGIFKQSDLVNAEVFHYSQALQYSGIDWGWVHIGFSLDKYTSDLQSIYVRTFILALVCILIGTLASFIFARQLSRPILSLHQVTERVAQGDLTARARIDTNDEVRDLANAFNQMAEALQKSHHELETRVNERTRELRNEINERKLAEEARLKAEEELETQRTLTMRADRLRSLGEMAAGIAHELNQPLVGVRGLAEHTLIGVQKGWELKQDGLAERMTKIIEQADRMVHIIQHVRMFAREAGKPDLEVVFVNEVVSSSIDLVDAQFRSQGLEIVSDLSNDLAPVHANPYSLEEVLLNLIKNARDAIEDRQRQDPKFEKGQVHLRTRLDQKEFENAVCIEVSDNGNGIHPDILAKIFDPFFTTKDPDKGTGLGMSISKSIIEDMGGTIQLHTALGKGTTVTVCLPVISINSKP